MNDNVTMSEITRLRALLIKAMRIATEAHKDQKDKADQPYILHLQTVSRKGRSVEEKIVGMLHDLVEDTDWTLNMLLKEGFDENLVSAIDCLSKRDGEASGIYVRRIKTNALATQVKIYDLEHNMDITRFLFLKQKDHERLDKYLAIYHDLKQHQIADLNSFT